MTEYVIRFLAGGAVVSALAMLGDLLRPKSFAAGETITTTGIAAHGASHLPSVEVDSFNIELKDEEGFLGNCASKTAFRDTLEKWRKPLRKSGEDPFGKELSEDIQQEGT